MQRTAKHERLTLAITEWLTRKYARVQIIGKFLVRIQGAVQKIYDEELNKMGTAEP